MPHSCHARTLTEADLPSVLALCESNPRYYQHFGEPPTLENLAGSMRALPPGCTPSQKSFLGFFDADELAAILDLVRGYPDEGCAYVGLFMVAASRQGRGLGTTLVEHVLDGLRGQGFSRVRLAYIEGNDQADAVVIAAMISRMLGDPIETGKVPEAKLRALKKVRLEDSLDPDALAAIPA